MNTGRSGMHAALSSSASAVHVCAGRELDGLDNREGGARMHGFGREMIPSPQIFYGDAESIGDGH